MEPQFKGFSDADSELVQLLDHKKTRLYEKSEKLELFNNFSYMEQLFSVYGKKVAKKTNQMKTFGTDKNCEKKEDHGTTSSNSNGIKRGGRKRKYLEPSNDELLSCGSAKLVCEGTLPAEETPKLLKQDKGHIVEELISKAGALNAKIDRCLKWLRVPEPFPGFRVKNLVLSKQYDQLFELQALPEMMAEHEKLMEKVLQFAPDEVDYEDQAGSL